MNPKIANPVLRNMKAVILAAGKGSRIAPFITTEGKTMIEFLGKPLIAHHVDEFIKNNIFEFVIICNEKNNEVIKEYFSKNYKKFKFEYSIQKEQYGPSHALLSAEKYLKETYFILKYGDSISSEDQVKKILDKYTDELDSDAVVTLRKVTNPREYGIAKFADKEKKKLIAIVEKPQNEIPSDLANVGLYIINGKKLFEEIKKQGILEVIAPPEYLLRAGSKCAFWITCSERCDVGRPWNIIETNEILIKKLGPKIESANLHPSAIIDKNVYIGPNAVINSNVIIKQFSSIDGFVDEGAIIENSIIMKGTKIGKNSIIKHSVIGRNNLIKDNFKTITKSEEIKVYVKGKYFVLNKDEIGCFTGENVTIMENLNCQAGKIVFPNKIITKNIDKDLLVHVILFDADNTLYTTRSAASSAILKVMEYFSEQCHKKPEELYEEWKKIVNNIKDSKEPEKRHHKYSFNILAEKYKLNHLEIALKILVEEVVRNIGEMPHLKETLEKLRDYDLGIITENHKYLTLPKLEKLDLEKYFKKIITSEDIGAMKPNIGYFENAFKEFEVDPKECMVVGDNYEKDLEIAKKMGAIVVIFGERDDRADFSIKDYNELLNILQEV